MKADTDKKCPKCKLINPPETMRCDCGYDFVEEDVKASYITATSNRYTYSTRRWLLLVAGALVCNLLIELLAAQMRGDSSALNWRRVLSTTGMAMILSRLFSWFAREENRLTAAIAVIVVYIIIRAFERFLAPQS